MARTATRQSNLRYGTDHSPSQRSVDSNARLGDDFANSHVAAPNHRRPLRGRARRAASPRPRLHDLRHGHDQMQSDTGQRVKNGVPFAFAGGGNGFDGDSGIRRATPPQTVTFTAQQSIQWRDLGDDFANGHGAAPNSRRPSRDQYTGSVASGQGYTISAHGHDNNGNLTASASGKMAAFAFAGEQRHDGDSSNRLRIPPQTVRSPRSV